MFDEKGLWIARNKASLANKKREADLANLATAINTCSAYSMPPSTQAVCASHDIALDYVLLTTLYDLLSKEIVDDHFDINPIHIKTNLKKFKLRLLQKQSALTKKPLKKHTSEQDQNDRETHINDQNNAQLQHNFNQEMFEADFLTVAQVLCAKWNITLSASDLSDLPLQSAIQETRETRETRETQTNVMQQREMRAKKIAVALLDPLINQWNIPNDGESGTAVPDRKYTPASIIQPPTTRKALKAFCEATRQYNYTYTCVFNQPHTETSKSNNIFTRAFHALQNWFDDLFYSNKTVLPAEPLYKKAITEWTKTLTFTSEFINMPHDNKRTTEKNKTPVEIATPIATQRNKQHQNLARLQQWHEEQMTAAFTSITQPNSILSADIIAKKPLKKNFLPLLFQKNYPHEPLSEKLHADLTLLEEIGMSGFKSAAYASKTDAESVKQQMTKQAAFYDRFSDRITQWQESLFKIRVMYTKQYRAHYINDEDYVKAIAALDTMLLPLHKKSTELIARCITEAKNTAIALCTENQDTLHKASECLLHFTTAKRSLTDVTVLQHACFDAEQSTEMVLGEAIGIAQNVKYDPICTYTLADHAVLRIADTKKTVQALLLTIHPDRNSGIPVIPDKYTAQLTDLIQQARRFSAQWNASQYGKINAEEASVACNAHINAKTVHPLEPAIPVDEQEVNPKTAYQPSSPMNTAILELQESYNEKLKQDQDLACRFKTARGIEKTHPSCQLYMHSHEPHGTDPISFVTNIREKARIAFTKQKNDALIAQAHQETAQLRQAKISSDKKAEEERKAKEEERKAKEEERKAKEEAISLLLYTAIETEKRSFLILDHEIAKAAINNENNHSFYLRLTTLTETLVNPLCAKMKSVRLAEIHAILLHILETQSDYPEIALLIQQEKQKRQMQQQDSQPTAAQATSAAPSITSAGLFAPASETVAHRKEETGNDSAPNQGTHTQ